METEADGGIMRPHGLLRTMHRRSLALSMKQKQ